MAALVVGARHASPLLPGMPVLIDDLHQGGIRRSTVNERSPGAGRTACRALDAVVFEALGLTENEQLEVYRAVVEMVKQRLTKARSV